MRGRLRHGIADLEAGITPRFPTMTFENRHTMQVLWQLASR